jgi:hypothetical protein
MTSNGLDDDILHLLGDRLIVFVGLMASGKTSVGRMWRNALAFPLLMRTMKLKPRRA